MIIKTFGAAWHSSFWENGMDDSMVCRRRVPMLGNEYLGFGWVGRQPLTSR